MNRAPVLLLARTGFIIRNLLLGTFAKSVTPYRPLIVAVPNPLDVQLRQLTSAQGICLIPFFDHSNGKPRSRFGKLTAWQTYVYRFKQAEKSTRSLEIQTRLFESPHSMIGQAGIQILTMTGRGLKRAGLMGQVEDQFLRAVAKWPVTSRWCEAFERCSPSVVISTMLTHATMAHASCDLSAVVAAQKLGIPCGTLVQSWDNLSSKTSILPASLDRYWTWSEKMSQELLALNPRVNSESLRVVGAPQFDFHRRPEIVESRDVFVRRVGLDPNRPFIVIGTGTRKWLPNEPHTIRQILEALKSSMPRVQTLIRLHPKDDGERWTSYRDQLITLGAVFQKTAPAQHMDNGGFVAPVDFYREQVNTLVHAAVVVNTASTLSVDAAILDRPTVSLGFDTVPDPIFPEGRAWSFNNSTHFAPLVASGGVTLVRSLAECLSVIKSYLEHPDLNSEGRERVATMVAGRCDGCAGERLAAEVLDLANGSGGLDPTEAGSAFDMAT